MTIRSIPLGGITTGTAADAAPDGELYEAINLRQKRGKYLPVRENRTEFIAGKALLDKFAGGFLPGYGPTGDTLPDDYRLLYIHRTDRYEHWISYAWGSLWCEMKKENGQFVPVVQRIAIMARPDDIRSTGNILVCILPDDIRHFLFTDAYRSIRDIRTPLDIRFTTREVAGIGAVKEEYANFVISRDNGNVIDNATPVNSDIYQHLDNITEHGLFYGPCLVRYAYRLYDGSCICQSAPILLPGKRGDKSVFLEQHYHSDNRRTWRFYAYANQIELQIQANDTLVQNKDIIQSIDIFLAHIPLYDNTDKYSLKLYQVEADGRLYNSTSEANWNQTDEIYSRYTPFSTLGLREKILQAADFRLIDSIKTSELGQNVTRTLNLSGKLKNLNTLEQLPDDDFSHNAFTAKTAFTYNSRLHLGNLSSRLFSGFTLKEFDTGQILLDHLNRRVPETPVRIKQSYIETLLKTEAGTTRVVAVANDFDFHAIAPYLSYPDPRAYQMTVSYLTADNRLFSRTYPLTPSNVLNLACYLPDDLDPRQETGFEAATALAVPPEENNIEYTGNKLRVSALDTPFSFPVEQTYTIGTGAIVGMAAATQALSQGQFGQFPLYIFTTDGIWTLETGTDSVAYTRQAPLCRDICSNPRSIAPLDSAVAFATEKGVMLLSGSSIHPLSDDLELAPAPLELSPEAARLLGLPARFPEADTPAFVPYLQEACIGYNYPEKEIYITNPRYDHYYACACPTGRWTRRQGRIETLIDGYPLLYGIDSDRRILNLTAEEGGTRPFTLLTRPLKLSGTSYKRLARTLLRGYFNGTLSAALLASDDGIRFQLVNRITGTARHRRDLGWGHTVKPFRYCIVALTAQAGSDLEIDRLDVDYEELPAPRLV